MILFSTKNPGTGQVPFAVEKADDGRGQPPENSATVTRGGQVLTDLQPRNQEKEGGGGRVSQTCISSTPEEVIRTKEAGGGQVSKGHTPRRIVLFSTKNPGTGQVLFAVEKTDDGRSQTPEDSATVCLKWEQAVSPRAGGGQLPLETTSTQINWGRQALAGLRPRNQRREGGGGRDSNPCKCSPSEKAKGLTKAGGGQVSEKPPSQRELISTKDPGGGQVSFVK